MPELTAKQRGHVKALSEGGWGIRAQTQSKSSAYRSKKQAEQQGLQVRVVKTDDGYKGGAWYTVYTKAK